MFSKDQLKSDALKRFMAQVPAGQKLFSQNDKGNTLFIIVDGSIKLLHKVLNTERTIAILGPGEMIGEKALCNPAPYKRTFTAVAEVETTVLEFDGASLKAISTKLPEFPLKMLEVVVQRLDKANELVGVLQVSGPAERFAQYIMYVNRHFAKKGASGGAFRLSPEEVSSAANLPQQLVSDLTNELLAEKILTRRDGAFVLTDENALLQYLPSLRERAAA